MYDKRISNGHGKLLTHRSLTERGGRLSTIYLCNGFRDSLTGAVNLLSTREYHLKRDLISRRASGAKGKSAGGIESFPFRIRRKKMLQL